MALMTRFEVYLVDLDPSMGSEMKKIRPCVIISPDELNRKLKTVIISPLTSVVRNYLCRIRCNYNNINGEIALDQIGAVDKTFLAKRLGFIETSTQVQLLKLLQDIFK